MKGIILIYYMNNAALFYAVTQAPKMIECSHPIVSSSVHMTYYGSRKRDGWYWLFYFAFSSSCLLHSLFILIIMTPHKWKGTFILGETDGILGVHLSFYIGWHSFYPVGFKRTSGILTFRKIALQANYLCLNIHY